jgi:hypothetical protein
MKVCLITATKNRHKQLERVVKFALDQTYDNFVHLIFNNSPISQKLNTNLPPEKFILVNSPTDTKTDSPYTTLGQIYIDAMRFVPEDVEIINFMDDDDVFLVNHVEEGVKGLIRGGLDAYKPQKSWYKHGKSLDLVQNTLEPSIFVKAEHVKKYGFSEETTAQHLQWVNPLVYEKRIFVDPEGPPTYICDWSQEIPTFKTSGDPNNPQNFQNYTEWSKDAGDGIITPCNDSWANHWRHIKTKK